MSEYISLGHTVRNILETARKEIQAVPRPGTTDRKQIKNIARPDDERDGEEFTRQQQIQKKIIDEDKNKSKYWYNDEGTWTMKNGKKVLVTPAPKNNQEDDSQRFKHEVKEGASASHLSKIKVKCPDCGGKQRDECDRCDGKGWVMGNHGKGAINKQNTGWKSRKAWLDEQDDQPEVEDPDEKDCECKHDDKKKSKKGKTKVDINPEVDNNIFASHEQKGKLVEQTKKSKDREVGTKSLVKTYTDDTPGQQLDELKDKTLKSYLKKATRPVTKKLKVAVRDPRSVERAEERLSGQLVHNRVPNNKKRFGDDWDVKKYRKEETNLNEVDLVKLQYQNKSGAWITAREITDSPNNLYVQMRNLQRTMEHQRVRAIGPKGELLDLWGPSMETDIPYKSGYTPVKVVESDLKEMTKGLLNRYLEKNEKWQSELRKDYTGKRPVGPISKEKEKSLRNRQVGASRAKDRLQGRRFVKPPKNDPLSQYSGLRNIKKYHSEETQLDEISRKLRQRYERANLKDQNRLRNAPEGGVDHERKIARKLRNRKRGYQDAIDRDLGYLKGPNEEKETQIDELTNKLYRYYNKSYVRARYGTKDGGKAEYKKRDPWLALAGKKIAALQKTGSSVINKKKKPLLKGFKMPLKDETEVDEACWKNYKMVGTKKKGKRTVPNCVPEDVNETAAWQRKEGKNPEGGLNQKGVESYRRENPGSKLSTAVTEKNPSGKRASRRKSFCARMSGMKSKLTSSKTASDPDSRINKSLRKWNC